MAKASKIYGVWACCLLGLVACVSVPSDITAPVITPDMALQRNLERQLALVSSDAAARHRLNQTMRFRTQLCQRCHGVDGHSRNGRCPNLAGQDPAYLVQQLQHFSDGRRQDFQMQSVAKKMTDDDKVAVALFFSSMSPRPSVEKVDELAMKGEAIFRVRCAQCHGMQGQGQYTYPRLAGQLPDYIRMTLHEFRKTESRRRISIMREIASLLSEAEIKAVAAYIGTMK